MPYHVPSRILLHIDRPLWHSGSDDARSFLAQASYIEYQLAQHARNVRLNDGNNNLSWNQTSSHAMLADIAQRLNRITATAKRAAATSLSNAIAKAGLHASFPALHAVANHIADVQHVDELAVAQVLADQGVASTAAASAKRNATEAYLAFAATAHQLYSVAEQVRDDAADPSAHKYIAHQIALVYQSLNQFGRESADAVRPLKRRIESRFEEVKSHIESQTASASTTNEPLLSNEQSAWIAGVASEAAQFVNAVPACMVERLEPLGSALRCGLRRGD